MNRLHKVTLTVLYAASASDVAFFITALSYVGHTVLLETFPDVVPVSVQVCSNTVVLSLTFFDLISILLYPFYALNANLILTFFDLLPWKNLHILK